MDNDLLRNGSCKNVSSHFIYVSSHGQNSKFNRFIARVYISEEESKQHYSMNVRFTVCSIIEAHKSTLKLLNIDMSNPKSLCPTFTCAVDKVSRSVRFGPQHALGMLGTEIQNRGLGGYCFSLLIQSLLKKGFGDYSVMPISLSIQDAQNEWSTLNRNHFYKSRGFDIDDLLIKNGSISVERLGQLSTNWNKKKVRPISNDYIFHFAANRQNDFSDLTSSLASSLNSKSHYVSLLDSEKETNSLFKLVIMSLVFVIAVLLGGFMSVFSVVTFSGLLTLILLNFGALESKIRKIKTNIHSSR